MNDKISKALSKIPYPVCVVTVGRGGVENGCTVSWLTQVAFEPALVCFAVAKVHYSEQIVRSTKTFVVNILPEAQANIARQFAKESLTGENKLKGVKNHPADGGAAILDDALAWLDCRVVDIHLAGDHWLVVGEVEDAGVEDDKAVALTSASGMRYHKSKPKN
jgi:flavin reductase (DIM6/NTAB) family NADH-FMN oxidoreductase RutF